MENEDGSTAATLEQRVGQLEGAMMLIQQVLGLLLSESPRAADRLMSGLSKPDELRDMLLPTTMLEEHIDGAQVMLDCVIARLRGSLPQRGN